MSTKSTQRFVGLVVAVVATTLLLMALPWRDGAAPEPQLEETSESSEGNEEVAPVLPIFEEQNGWWVLTRYGVRLKAPEGWELRGRKNRPYAYRDAESPLSGNINVLSLPNFYHVDLAAVAAENEASLGASEELELISIEDVTLGGDHQALRIDYRGNPTDQELRFSAIVFLLGGHQVVITATALLEEWGAVEGEVRACFETIEMLDLATMNLEELVETADY